MSMRLASLDDDDQICSLIARMARDVGFLAEAAEDVASFQALFHENRPGAVILDLQLKSSDGIEQLRFLHQEGFVGPIVLMSGFDQRVLAAAEKIGARSEENTSELQSLMRNSYAVFCLKNKNKRTQQ